MLKKIKVKPVFSTPWFHITDSPMHGSDAPYYVVQAPDCVCVVAVTTKGSVLLVKQYRVTQGETTLEFPSGHIEKGEKPHAAAYRELLEETGFRAGTIKPLGVLATDTGRLGNKLWCYYAADLSYDRKPVDQDILKVYERKPCTVLQYVRSGKMVHAQDIAAFFLAVQKMKLRLHSDQN
jgi:ADP-ribose pyrophosphatase